MSAILDLLQAAGRGEWLIWTLRWLPLLVAATGLWVTASAAGIRKLEPADAPYGIRGPVLAMEFVRTPADVQQIVGPPGDLKRQAMLTATRVDFLFIATYFALFLVMSMLLAQRGSPFVTLAGIAALCALGAAAADLYENVRILQALGPAQATQSLVDHIRHAAYLKWGLSFAAIGILALTFFGRSGWLLLLVGLAFVLTAAVGLVGLWQKPLLETALKLLGVGLFLLSLAAWTSRDQMLSSATGAAPAAPAGGKHPAHATGFS